ncbi:Potassium channel subfamily K member 1 [Cricetulus griseus]|uniref:Potassium channel subfamily K member 1 n=1 Tax=Cricetulus griseus TaxID=10029 RepID=G3GWZ3_CRIGR|nr:Potassium channel subfamily K member 1 [Cricetulus griseus]
MLQSLAGSSCVRLVERHRSAWCFGFLVLGYLLYLVFGAVVFSSVELPYEDLLRQELRKLKRRFLEEHECLSEPQLEQFLGRVLEASNYGVSVLSNASGNWNWDFTSALFFASTVLSTTGRAAAATLPCPQRPQASPEHILPWPAGAAREVTSEHYSSGVVPNNLNLAAAGALFSLFHSCGDPELMGRWVPDILLSWKLSSESRG